MWTTECEDGVIRPWYCVHDKGCSTKLGLAGIILSAEVYYRDGTLVSQHGCN